MKKIAKAILSFAMALSFSVTAMAAPSIIGSLDVSKATASNGATVTSNSDFTSAPQDVQDVIKAVNAATTDKTVGQLVPGAAGMKVVAADGSESSLDVSAAKFLSAFVNMTVDPAPTAENPVDVTFPVNNLTANITVYALHYCAEHGWELLPGTVNGSQVTFTFHSASPVALIYLPKAGSSAAGSAAGSTAAGTTAPKTGETNAFAFILMLGVALASVGGFAVYKSRKEA